MGEPHMIWAFAALLLLLFGALTFLLVLRSSDEPQLHLTHLRLLIPDLPPELAGRRIGFLSDLHVDRMYVPADELLAAVSAANPDILLIGGDLAYSGAQHREALELLERLGADRPTFAVRGNTDVVQRLDSDALRAALQPGGGGLLVNEVGRVSFGASAVEILGVDDPKEGGSAPAQTVAQADPGAAVRIGLAHSPALWQELGAFAAHLCIYGHTHGGQVRLPRLEAPLTHTSYPRQLAAGLFRLIEGAPPRFETIANHWQLLSASGSPLETAAGARDLFFVSRGVGVSWLPMRLLCPPEMVLVELAGDQTNGSD